LLEQAWHLRNITSNFLTFKAMKSQCRISAQQKKLLNFRSLTQRRLAAGIDDLKDWQKWLKKLVY